MKHRLSILSLGLLLLLMLIAPQISVRGEPDTFIIEYADATNTLSLTGSSDLVALISNVSARFVIDHANARNTLFLTTPPASLLAVLGVVEDRFVIDHANKSNTIGLYYPRDLIGDTTAPEVIEVSASLSGGNLNVVVVSDEYTTAVLEYGLAPGVYPTTLADDLYAYAHTFTLPALASDQVYYYRLTLTDRSGNITHTAEATLEPILSIYLPALLKR